MNFPPWMRFISCVSRLDMVCLFKTSFLLSFLAFTITSSVKTLRLYRHSQLQVRQVGGQIVSLLVTLAPPCNSCISLLSRWDTVLLFRTSFLSNFLAVMGYLLFLFNVCQQSIFNSNRFHHTIYTHSPPKCQAKKIISEIFSGKLGLAGFRDLGPFGDEVVGFLAGEGLGHTADGHHGHLQPGVMGGAADVGHQHHVL